MKDHFLPYIVREKPEPFSAYTIEVSTMDTNPDLATLESMRNHLQKEKHK